jgi:hypothetical protein|tara:strand:- start:328 stop:561 length:234 start_codon:yes stop_codon:yes gene_type:complete
MTKLLLINDEHIIEAFAGGISFMIIVYFLIKILKTNKLLIGGMSFFFTWGVRKIAVNIYKYFKIRYGYSIRSISINI